MVPVWKGNTGLFIPVIRDENGIVRLVYRYLF
jgi:hypothetical protein